MVLSTKEQVHTPEACFSTLHNESDPQFFLLLEFSLFFDLPPDMYPWLQSCQTPLPGGFLPPYPACVLFCLRCSVLLAVFFSVVCWRLRFPPLSSLCLQMQSLFSCLLVYWAVSFSRVNYIVTNELINSQRVWAMLTVTGAWRYHWKYTRELNLFLYNGKHRCYRKVLRPGCKDRARRRWI